MNHSVFERIMRHMTTSLKQLNAITSDFTPDVELQQIRAAAHQAEQVAAELNKLVGIFEAEITERTR